jgi:hypothetical protein
MSKYRHYPWEEWTNGEVHTLVSGIDFDQPISEMVGMLHRHARKSPKRLRAQTKSGPPLTPGTMRIRFVRRLWWEIDEGESNGNAESENGNS